MTRTSSVHDVADGLTAARLLDLTAERNSLRRVAELVARGVEQNVVLDAIVTEAFALFGVGCTALLRYGSGGAASIIALHHGPPGLGIGDTAPQVAGGLVPRVLHSGRPARVEAYDALPDPEVAHLHELGITAGAAAPILVEGALWGVLAAMTRSGTVAAGLERRLAEFAELAAVAVAGAQAKDDLRELVDDRAALRRVAELVAREGALDDVFVAVAAEVSKLLGDVGVTMVRYDSDDSVVSVGYCNGRRSARPQSKLGHEVVGPLPVRSQVSVPVTVGGHVRGQLTAAGVSPLPVGTEDRLAPFAELAAAAIANARHKIEIAASRARVVAAADEARRRLQHDVHDGAQQRLVQTIITLKRARHAAEGTSTAELVDEALYHAERANSQLRDLVHGLLPASLGRGGLRYAIESLTDGVAFPVELQLDAPGLPIDVETTAYFIVAEALTNVIKHARSSGVRISIGIDQGTLFVEVHDDGSGGADPALGSGLSGLSDRVVAADGTFTVTSVAGNGTTVRAILPVPHLATG